MSSVPVIISDLSEVSEALRPHYAKDGDFYVVQVEGLDAHPAVVAMKEAHERAKASKAKLKSGLATVDQAYREAMKAAHLARKAALADLAKEAGNDAEGAPA